MSERTFSPWRDLAITAAVVAILVKLGGWTLPFVIVAVLLMIVGHEFGHFITAKWTGMKVTEFFVGFGPRLWSTTRGETEFGIKALPLGGYVKIVGMSSLEEIDDAEEPRSYRAQSYPRRLLVASAGSIMHVLMAFLLVMASLTIFGTQDPNRVNVAALSSWGDYGTTPAQAMGLHVGDEITRIDGRPLHDVTTMILFVRKSAGQSVRLTVRRNGHTLTLVGRPVDGRTVHLVGTTLAPTTGPSAGYFGVELGNPVARVNPWHALPQSFTVVRLTLGSAISSLPSMFSPSRFLSLFHETTSSQAAQQAAQSGNRPVSGVGAVRLAVQSAHAGARQFLGLMVTLNLFIGVLNMLPMLPLDGGLVLVATYERLRSRKGRPRYQADVRKLTPVVVAFLAVLGFLFFTTLYLDVVHPIVNPFH